MSDDQIKVTDAATDRELTDLELAVLARPWNYASGHTIAERLARRNLLVRGLNGFFRTASGAAALTEACNDIR
jgi:hypothetical protein